MFTDLIQLARPKHWIKNVFVLLPVPFALKATGGERFFDSLSFLLGLAGFCLVNSAVYTLNDLCDAEADRLHPRKCRRPIAAGRVPKFVAAVAEIFVLLIAGLGLCVAAGKPATLTIVPAYVAINVVYNLGAKHVALLDVFLLSSGFVIRVLLGCVLVSAAPSPWLLLCTSTLALFLGFAKRAGRLDRGAGPEPSAQPPRLQQGVSRPGGEHLRRRGDLGLRPVLHRGQGGVAARPRDGLACRSWPTES